MSSLLNAAAVRSTCRKIYEGTQNGEGHFVLNEQCLPKLVDYVVDVIKQNYPDLNIPYHSRWGHFRAGSQQRLDLLGEYLRDKDTIEKTRCHFDLVIPSVLLDAGAGPQWKFKEDETGIELGRSEGLGIASFHMYLNGGLNDLENLTAQDVASAFQVTTDNPLAGLEGRAGLVRALGLAVKARPDIFLNGRVGGLVDFLKNKFGNTIPAPEILKAILIGLSDIWPGRLKSEEGENLGDVWNHSVWGLTAFHKLSQWLTYSLVEPLEWAGFQVTDLNGLTGLAEYRNGGLFVDGDVLAPKKSAMLEKSHHPSSDFVIEWRALSVCLLDEVAPLVRERIGKSEDEFPLAKVLEGGTWWAGRKLAAERRADKSPPIRIESDGTVF